MSKWQRNKILVECPLAVKNSFAAPADLFEVVAGTNYLRIETWLEFYTQVNTYPDTEPQYEFAFASTVFTPVRVQRGFRLTVNDGRLVTLKILQYLRKISVTSGYNKHSPIKILDYCSPEPEDLIALGNNAYTSRLGLYTIQDSPGAVKFGATLNTGTSFVVDFRESSLREA